MTRSTFGSLNNLLDEYPRECLSIDMASKLASEDILERLSDLFIHRGVPAYIRSDKDAEFTAQAVREWWQRVEVNTLFIEPGSPWENGYIESFNGNLRGELLNREIFETLLESQVLIERWRVADNTVRPQGSLGYRSPAPEAWRVPLEPASAPLQQLPTATSKDPKLTHINVGAITGGRSAVIVSAGYLRSFEGIQNVDHGRAMALATLTSARIYYSGSQPLMNPRGLGDVHRNSGEFVRLNSNALARRAAAFDPAPLG